MISDFSERNLPDFKTDEYLDQLNYRDLSFSIYKSFQYDCYYTIIQGKPIYICPANQDYRTNIKDVIDINLNLVADLGKDAKLVKFQNGAHEDIKLIVRGRTVKVYLIADPEHLDIDGLIASAKNILNKYKETLY